MNPTQFNAYVAALDLRENYQGVVSLGLGIKAAAVQKMELILKARQQGIVLEEVWPESDQPEICPLIIVEPQDDRNRRAIGYDLLSEGQLRSAAMSAAESGKPVATAKGLIHKGSASSGKGFSILVPVYRGGGQPASPEERQTNLAGLVHCAFETEKLLAHVVPKGTKSTVGLRIYDGPAVSDGSLMYQTPNWPAATNFFQSLGVSRMTLASRPWTLLFVSPPNVASAAPVLITLVGGLALSGLFWRVALFQSRARERAEQHAFELQKSEGALRQSESRRVRAEALSSVMVAHIGLDGGWLKVPPALPRLLGYPETELEVKGLAAVMHADDRQAEAQSREMLVAGKQTTAEIETRLIAHDGSVAWVAVNYSLVADAEGKPIYLLTYIQDVSERKQHEAEIKKLNGLLEDRVAQRTAELRVVVEDLEAFSYSVSHDLRAPLRHIDGYVNLLKGSPSVAEDASTQRFATIVSDAAQQMTELIDALLNFSRLGRVDLSVAPAINVDEIVREARQILEVETEKRVIKWSIAPLPKVSADRTLLRQVFTNLLSNAVKYSGPRSPAVIEVGSQESDEEVVFFVRDNGVGFSMEYADKLFGVFQRLHTSEEFEGTGIGLANIRKIVSRHGGRTWAEGAPDQGATFYFTLPKRLNNSVGSNGVRGIETVDRLDI